ISTFISSNYSRYYNILHPYIAYNKKSEATRKKRNSNSEFFHPNLTKRVRINTISNFHKEEALLKVLTFIVYNNISFFALDPEYF
ncbi:hypothetical protein QBC39DRAFT_270818, partial [Podospora conica]